MIGTDFEKIHFVLFGWDLVEPMALITDVIMGSISIYFGLKIRSYKNAHPFYQYWMWFFLIFGIGSFYGGFAHAFFNYWGIPGKIPSWISGPISVYCLEQAMISINEKDKAYSRLKIFSFWKLILVFVAFILILSLANLEQKPGLGFLPIAINTILGVSAAAGVLGLIYYRKGYSALYKYFALGVLVMLPSAFVFLLKINLHPWFDKNDLSHLLLTIGIIYFYLGVKHLHKQGFHQDAYI
ncbi:MAG: hypothetical protein HUJ25_17355 [Crocinitomicaceae bacterium]|nr:hypothetical protein [Crocinitomicaceae bacterium]